jgi:hypothetical protein
MPGGMPNHQGDRNGLLASRFSNIDRDLGISENRVSQPRTKLRSVSRPLAEAGPKDVESASKNYVR